ncbi:MAG: Flagellar hook-length control protein [Rhodobacteraceae bacterium HLUCCA08]|nr:MAG: Flagellar hook-length control protein [Rhodobacteraceae bacterium HLUCCA08]
MQPIIPNELATLFAAVPGGKALGEEGSATAFAAFVADRSGGEESPLLWQVLAAAGAAEGASDPKVDPAEIQADAGADPDPPAQAADMDAADVTLRPDIAIAEPDKASDPSLRGTEAVPAGQALPPGSDPDLAATAQGLVLPRRGPVSELAMAPGATTDRGGRRAEAAGTSSGRTPSISAEPLAPGGDGPPAARLSEAAQAAREALVEFASTRRQSREHAADAAAAAERPARAPMQTVPAQIIQASLQPLTHVIAANLAPDPRDSTRFGRDRDALSELVAVSAGEARAAPAASAGAPALQSAPQQPIAQQLALAISRSAGGETEITLHPEELGRVRLSVSGGEGALTLSIIADRPETGDLIRRHLDQLSAEFRDMGYANLSFSFGSAPQQGRSDTHQDAADPGVTDDWIELEPVSRSDATSATAASGLDLRL